MTADSSSPRGGTVATARAIDLDRFLDGQPISSAQLAALGMCTFALLIDGFDVLLVGNLAPAIAPHFGVATTRLTLVFLFQQVGLAAGGFLISPIADRIGRKIVLLACAAAFGLLTLAGTQASTLLQFAVLRGAAGLFLSALVPNALALLVEATPRRRRGLFVSIAFAGYGAGSVGGALVGALLLRRWGWQSGFWIGGCVPLLYVALAAVVLPESLHVLHRRNPDDPAIAATARRLCPALGDGALVVTPARAGVPVVAWRGIFAGGYGRSTALLWAIFFLSTGTVGLMFAWMPTFFHERGGISLVAYSSVASFALAGALIGTLSIGLVLDRFRSTRVLMANFMLSILAMQLLGGARFGTIWFGLALLGVSVFQGSGQTALSATVAQLYPSGMRTTGLGWAFGAGRIGGIVGPLVGGMMLAARFSVPAFFLALALPLGLTVVLLAVLERAEMARHAAGRAETDADMLEGAAL